MKLTKSLFLAFAGLGLFACSNEEITDNGGVQGEATVSVRIDEPAISRAIAAEDFTPGNTIDVTLNSIKLKLTAQTGGSEITFNLSNYENDRAKLLEAVNKYQFEGVRNPSKMEVFINGGKTGVGDDVLTLSDVVTTGLAEPLYASSTNFVLKDDIETPKDGIDEYEVQLTPEHTVARLEFGGIKHIHSKKAEGNEDLKPCMFATIDIDGIFMNNVAGATNGITNWATAQTNTPVHSIIGPESFVENKTWPADNKCYGYNILPVESGNLPVLTVCFSGITIDASKPEYSTTVWGNNDGFGYATVKNYKLDETSSAYKKAFGVGDDGIITKFPAGYIYQVKSLEIPDEAIGTTITGGEDVHVYAVVTVSEWSIVQGSVEWN